MISGKNNLTVQEWNKFYIELIVLYVHPKIAIMLDHSRLGLENKFFPNKITKAKKKTKTTWHVQHTFFVQSFLCRCFARRQRETSRNFLVTRFMEEMLYVVLFTFVSLPLISTLVAASISHFLTAAVKFSSCSSNEIGLLCFFIPGSSFFSVIHANVDFKIKSKERIGFVVVVFYL